MNAMDELLRDLNGGVLIFQTGREKLVADAYSVIWESTLLAEPVDFVITTVQCKASFTLVETGLPQSEMQHYSQRDPRWRDTVYAGGLTFAQAGCYVTCVAMVLSKAGYDDEPPEVAQKLAGAGVFSGALLSRPDRIPGVYNHMRWDGVVDWRDRPADLIQLRQLLDDGPVILEVDFRPGGVLDQHFVVATAFSDDGHDLVIVDPWDGAETHLMQRYAKEDWGLARAIYGARLLRVA